MNLFFPQLFFDLPPMPDKMKINKRSNMIRILKNIIDNTGFRIIKSKNVNDLLAIKHKYFKTIDELVGIYQEKIFHDLPVNEDRKILLSKLGGTNLSEAIYIIGCLNKSLIVDGDICEFGVASGATSALMGNEIIKTNKTIWLFDSFKGLPKPTEKDTLIHDIYNLGNINKYEGTMSFSGEHVINRLKDIKFPSQRVKIINGFIEDTIKLNHLPEKVCFAYVDFDFYEPIKIAIDFLHTRMPVGGCIIIDDYGWFSSGVQKAVDEFIIKNTDSYKFLKFNNFAGNFCVLHRIKQ
jgi:hypothetical protein